MKYQIWEQRGSQRTLIARVANSADADIMARAMARNVPPGRSINVETKDELLAMFSGEAEVNFQ